MSRWTLTLIPAWDDGPPPAVRVRRLLKLALRVCRLRCVGVEMLTEPPPLRRAAQSGGTPAPERAANKRKGPSEASGR